MTVPAREAASGTRLTPQLLFGLIIIAVGVLLTLDRLGLVDARYYLRLWPAALILVGLVKLWHARDGMGGAVGGFLFTVAGTWLLLERTDIVRLSFWDLWPALLVFLGGVLVWQALTRPGARSPVSGNDTIHAVAVMGGVARGNNSTAFRGGDVAAIMGGCEIDLRQASIDGEAVLDVFALWGGIEIRVPDDWTIVLRVTPLLGGADDKTRPPQGVSRHRLIIRGAVLMAGVEVKH
jgi:predicted membrane protein